MTDIKFSKIFNKTNSFVYILFCMILPWSLAGMQIAFGLLIVIFIISSVYRCKFEIKYHPFYLFILFFLCANIITLLFTTDNYASLKKFIDHDWVIFLIPLFISIPVSSSLRERGFKVLLLSAALVGIYGIIQHFIGIEFFRDKPLGALGHFYRAVGGYSFYLTYAGNQFFVFCCAFAFFFYRVLVPREKCHYSLCLLYF